MILLLFLFLSACLISEGKDIVCEYNRTLTMNVILNERGNIYSKGFREGLNHPPGFHCRTRLAAPENTHIRLKFNSLDLVVNYLCRVDKLVVVDFDRQTNAAVASGVYCGNVSIPDILSVNNTVQINLETGYFGAGKGFNISYFITTVPDLCPRGSVTCRNRKCVQKPNSVCDGVDDCGDGTDEEECGFAIAPEKCGQPEVKPVLSGFDRIVGGREALRGSWPWQVDMQDNSVLPNGHYCGGTLLNAEWFITAAHCLMNIRVPYKARIHLGNHHKYKPDPYEQIRYMKDYEVYGVKKEEFLKTGEFNMSHDLALVRMNAPVMFSPHVQPACLPLPKEELGHGRKCYATGWGMTRGSKSDAVLKQAEHPIQYERRCQNEFQEFENKTMICAGRLDPLNGLCHGDSGGPLVCQRDGTWYVYGAASFVTDSNFVEGLCGIANKPTVFNKISAKIDWITATIQNK